jgi:two-component system, NarL family, nitrate/nitrite response regulator NarL
MSTHRRRARVALVDQFRLVTQALDLALSSTCCPVPIPVQTLHSTSEVLAAILRRRVDVVVLVPSLGGSVDSEQLVEELTARGRIVIGLAHHEHARERLSRAGATATTLVGDGVAAVREAIAEARVTVPLRVVASEPVPLDSRRIALRRLGSLTRREVDVLAHLVRGRSAAEIARHHVVTEMTVRTQVKSILRKLEVGNQLAAVALAREVGWEPPFPEAA